MPIIDTVETDKPVARQPPRVAGPERPAGPPPIWRPEPTSLTRAELRRIVRETIG